MAPETTHPMRGPSTPTGTAAIVQAGLDNARQTIFSAADVPLASAEELLAAINGPAVKAVLEMRIEQMVKHGHTATSDLDRPLAFLLMEARNTAQMALDCLPTERRNLKVARRRAVKSAGLILAWIDRLDAAIASGEIQ